MEKYSNLTLDFNPLHFDSKFAKDAGFDHSLVPGMLVASVFPRVIASHFVSSSFSLLLLPSSLSSDSLILVFVM